ncbi:hypothetical protein [Haloactinomyces albus]|uniref:Uncharacterized protein n=1 Tax=Haloactinomyces albus TaxID=1352928 RepID=A0AAE3Z9Z7_9ACTN|nr:hypothetical protein [Haloactinomyces albus]MDR7301071.1 hypothetical protein [Haloactinomyces albus]
MLLAQFLTPDTGILVLTFLGGLVLATLVFWPILHRAKHSGGAERGAVRSGGEGRHALNRRGTTKPARAVNTTSKHSVRPTHPTASAQSTDSAAQASTASAMRSVPSEGAEPSQADPHEPQAIATEANPPAQRSEEPVDLPELPSDLFRQHHAAHFERVRERANRLRTELTER